jgi:hypothetical protein
MIRQMSQDKLFGRPIVTEVLPLSNYWPAEEYHQDFFRKEPLPGLLHGRGRAQGGEVPQDLQGPREGMRPASRGYRVIHTQGLRYQYPKRARAGVCRRGPCPRAPRWCCAATPAAGKSTWLALVAGLLSATGAKH